MEGIFLGYKLGTLSSKTAPTALTGRVLRSGKDAGFATISFREPAVHNPPLVRPSRPVFWVLCGVYSCCVTTVPDEITTLSIMKEVKWWMDLLLLFVNALYHGG